MPSFIRISALVRQMLIPPQFRIQPPDFTGSTPPLEILLRELSQKTEAPSEDGLPKDFALDLANQSFRLAQNVKALELAGIQNKDTRMLNRTLQAIDRAMKKYNVEAIDFTGKPFLAGQRDLEVLGQAEKSCDVSEPTVVFCERPAVFIKGMLAQTAKVMVAVPETREDTGTPLNSTENAT